MPATQSLVDLLAAQPNVDTTGWFGKLWGITHELSKKLANRFELKPDGSTEQFADYTSLDGNAKGSLNTFVGPEIDWLVHSHIGNPKHSFTNMHFTVWLGPQTKAPHFGMAMGTMPDIFFYFDYMPRVELLTNPDYLDKYYECARKRCQAARGKRERAETSFCHSPFIQAVRAFAVKIAPSTCHCAPGSFKRWVTICLQPLSMTPLPINKLEARNWS